LGLASRSLSGRWRRRLGLVYRRGQEHLHSPDPDYAAKLSLVRRARQEARRGGSQVVLVYLDGFTSYRRPSAARCWGSAGGPGPPAEQGYGRNRKRRVVAALNALTGRLTYGPGTKAGVVELGRFYRQLVEAYPQAAVISVARTTGQCTSCRG
jgi:hypothetical protein